MEKDSAISILTQQAINSGRSIIQMQQILTGDYGRDLRDHPEFQQLLAEMGDVFSARISTQSKDNIFHQLQLAVRNGTAPERFPVGTIFPDTWTDHDSGEVYQMPFIVVDYRPMELVSDSTMQFSAILLRKNATPKSLKFHHMDKNTYHDSLAHQYLNDNDTYLKGCSSELLDVVTPVRIPIESLDGKVDKVEAYFFLPTLEELHLDLYGNPRLEELTWQYFRDTPTDYSLPCPKRTFCTPSMQPRACWLRSAYRGSATYVWVADTDGSALIYLALSTLACSPACVIA